jgi:hypothetical protein
MTCIAGIARGGTVWIGGDSAGANTSWQLQLRAEPKVFRSGPFLIGYTTSFRMGQLLAHALRPPERLASRDLMTFMVTDFVDAVRACLKEGGFAKTEAGMESAGEFLVGTEGRLFSVQGDYNVGESTDGSPPAAAPNMLPWGRCTPWASASRQSGGSSGHWRSPRR